MRHAFFEEHSEISYTAKSLVDNDTNIVLWYGGHVDGHENYYDNGVIRDANSSFLSFDYRIPKGTPSGDYTCYISEKVNTTQSGLIMEDLTISDAKHRLEPGKDFALKPITFTVYERGDFNCDGTVSIDDAQSTLLYYVRKVVSKLNVTDEDLKTLAGTEHTGAARLAADASGDGTLDASDPQGILNYYVIAMTNQKPDWNKIYRH